MIGNGRPAIESAFLLALSPVACFVWVQVEEVGMGKKWVWAEDRKCESWPKQ